MKTVSLCLLSLLIYLHTNAQLIFPQVKLHHANTASIISYLTETQRELQQTDITLNMIFYKKSLASHHYTFDVLYKNIPLLNACIKVNTDLNGNILSIKKENISNENLTHIDVEHEKIMWSQKDISTLYPRAVPYKNFELKIDARTEMPMVVGVINSYDKTYDFTYVINLNGELIEEWNNSRYVKKDSIIHAHVFKPDPLTYLLQSYGTPYIDDTDKNLAWFVPAYLQQDILATFETNSQTFYLENDLVVIDDFDSPNIQPATSLTPDFYFNRSESGFEDVNVLYHITAFHDHIASIGYDTLMDEGITVDTHGMLGADNSMFNRNGGFPTLDFGTGGVDDAEDADVIIHEYSHALSWSANGNDNFNNPRMGLDEGVADYFATSYSRTISPFAWEKMFTWDGHNEFWGGRTATTPNNYPAGANIYAVGEVWNAAMSAIWTDLGQIVTDKLMLEAMHFFTNNTPLSEAAVYVLQSDTILFNGIHSGIICAHFQNKNILTANCKPSATAEILKDTNAINVRNTYGFSFLNEDLQILFDASSSGTYSVYDILGNKVLEENFNDKSSVFVSPQTFAAGIYLLKIQAGKNVLTIKISR